MVAGGAFEGRCRFHFCCFRIWCRAIVPVVSSVQDLDAPPSHFSVVVIGNAFHRLPRDLVRTGCSGWLQPGGFLALCWSSGHPGRDRSTGRSPSAVCCAGGGRRSAAATASPPTGTSRGGNGPTPPCSPRPGSRLIGRIRVPGRAPTGRCRNSPGYARSLSVLPAAALADHSAAFDDSLSAELGPYARDGRLTETVSFAFELAVKGPSVAA